MASRSKISGIFLVILLFSSCAGQKTQVDSDKAAFHYQLALSALAEKDYTGSLSELLRAQSFNPEDAEINHLLGLAYYAKNRPREAIVAYRKAIELRKDYSEAYNNLGVVYLALKKYDQARHNFEKARDNLLYNHPENAYLNLGLLEIELGRHDAALRYLGRAKQVSPRFCGAYYYSAKVLEKQKKINLAIENVKESIKFCPNFAEAYRYGATLWLKKRKSTIAVKYFEKAYSLSPDSDVGRESMRYIKLLRKSRK